MLLPKGKTLGTVLFLITSQIEWYKLRSFSFYRTEVTGFVYSQALWPKYRPMHFQCTFINNRVRL